MNLSEFEKLYKSSFNRLCNKAFHITNDRDAAKDIVQNVFFRLWNKKDQLVIHSVPDAYIYKSVINESLNYLDSQKRKYENIGDKEEIEIEDEGTIEDEINLKELEKKIDRIFASLPPKCRNVFLLSRYENMSYKEIAEFLNISENTVDNHIKKALTIFRNALLKLIILFR